MNSSYFLLPTLLLSACATTVDLPNVVIINADDLGYGDLSAYGTSSVPTPNFDRIASMGVRLTNAHLSSATSTPSRFSLLTGMYAWRFEGTGVASGDAGMIIRPGTATIASSLKDNGYATAAIGKWHLGIGDSTGTQNWNGQIEPALSDIGFDYSYIMAATADRVPCVFIENGRVVGLDPEDSLQVSYIRNFPGEPTGKENPELLTLLPSHGHDQAIVNGISRIGYMKGAMKARWVDSDIADSVSSHAVRFISDNRDHPFFLYFATNDIHVPRVPHKRFAGQSGLGARGDAILEFDWQVGRIVSALEEYGLMDNTLLIVTSDNGPVIDDGYADMAWELLGDHRPWAWMRGAKYSVYEAGTRIPMAVYWKGHTKTGCVSDAAFSQVDMYSSILSAIGVETQVKDSENHLDVLLGCDSLGREWIVEHGYAFSLMTRDGWKYIEPSSAIQIAWQTGIDTGCREQHQLFNLCIDSLENQNVAAMFPSKVDSLKTILDNIKKAGE